MAEDGQEEQRLTFWGFLAMSAEAWPLLLVVPLILSVGAYFVTNTPAEVQSSVTLPLPYVQLTEISMPSAVDAALLEDLSFTRPEVLQILSISPSPTDPDRSTLSLRYTLPMEGERLLGRIANDVIRQASLTYAEASKSALAEDLLNTRAKIATLEQVRKNMESALAAPDVVPQKIEGVAAAALALVQILEDIHAGRLEERKIVQDLAKFDREFAKPLKINTEPAPRPSPLRTALLVAFSTATMLLVLVILWNKLRRQRPEDSSDIARIRRAFGIGRSG